MLAIQRMASLFSLRTNKEQDRAQQRREQK